MVVEVGAGRAGLRQLVEWVVMGLLEQGALVARVALRMAARLEPQEAALEETVLSGGLVMGRVAAVVAGIRITVSVASQGNGAELGAEVVWVEGPKGLAARERVACL